MNYSDLDEVSVRLDMHLFHMLFTIVKGNMLSLIADLTGDYARYTFAIITMWKHVNLNSSSRRINAMQAMQDLPYHGDAGAWSIDFVARTRELYDSGATLEHFVMQCAFNSFEGKNSQVQSMITGDINNEKLVKPGMNIQALASKYATFLSTINAQKGTGKINISMRKKRWCENCKSKTHDTEYCRKGKKEADGEIRCHYCKRKGHIQPECPLKKRHEEEIKEEEEEEDEEEAENSDDDNASLTQSSPITPRATKKKEKKVNTAQVSDTAIADLMGRLKRGEIKLAI